MRRMQDVLEMPDKAKDTGLKVAISAWHNIAKGKVLGLVGGAVGHLTPIPGGSLMGASVGTYAQKQLLKMLSTSPNALNLYDYAIRNAIKPEIAGPLISNEVLREHGSDAGAMNRTVQTSPQDYLELGKEGAKAAAGVK